jgi:hypothetical protein
LFWLFFLSWNLHVLPHVLALYCKICTIGNCFFPPTTTKRNNGADILFSDLETVLPNNVGESQLLEFCVVVLYAHNLAKIEQFTCLVHPSLPLTYIPEKMRDVEFSATPHIVYFELKIFNVFNGALLISICLFIYCISSQVIYMMMDLGRDR